MNDRHLTPAERSWLDLERRRSPRYHMAAAVAWKEDRVASVGRVGETLARLLTDDLIAQRAWPPEPRR